MMTLLLGRLARMIPQLLIISVGAFALVLLLPGDPAVTLAGDNASTEQVARIREVMGLNDPWFVRYFTWLIAGVQGDFGASLFSGASVGDLIFSRFPVTAWLALIAVIIAVLFGVPAGIFAAVYRGSWVDRTVTVAASAGIAIPSFWLGLMLIVVFAVQMGILPSGGYSPPSAGFGNWLLTLLLPATALSATPAAELARHTRSAMISVLEQDFVRTARSKGTREGTIMLRHALRNAASPVITILSFQIAFLLGGSVIIEQIFGLPGVGSLAVQAVHEKDFPVLQGVVVISAVIVMVVNLFTDVLYGLLNPKVRAL